jgi:tryptophan halogenase
MSKDNFNKVEKILIVGGGTAGWFAASAISKWLPDVELSLVESPNVGTIGVGESTIAHINKFFNSLDMNIEGEEDWMPHCNAIYKASIQFSDFYQKGDSYMYPFGSLDLSGCRFACDDWFLKKWLYPDTKPRDFVDTFFPQMPLIYKNKVTKNEVFNDQGDRPIENYFPKRDMAYQLDAVKLAQWMKGKFCKDITHIEDDVINIAVNNQGFINGISTVNHGELKADLYLDCSGFKSLLIEGTLNEPWIDWRDDLINNRTWATHIPYKDKETEMRLYTDCKGIDNGWVWNIPLWENIGTGYVFSNDFVSEDNALKEFQDHIGYGDELDYKLINIRNGRHKRAWVKNCVAIGLSNGFVEPLESSGLLLIHEPIELLIKTLTQRGGLINQFDRDSFNFISNQTIDSWKYFVASHFYMSQRDDTEYWQYYTQTHEMGDHWYGVDLKHPEFWPSGVNQQLSIMGNTATDVGMLLAISKLKSQTTFSLGPAHLCIAVGNGFEIYNDYACTQLDWTEDGYRNLNKEFLRNTDLMDIWTMQTDRYVKHSKYAETLPSHYEYLKKNVYK